MVVQNDFMQLRQIVNDVVTQYTDLRKRIDWKDNGKSATILGLAKPFLTGYFTIAVAGKMSSGKSTFINSLIGENLLPTGHFQTTSGITWIVSSDKRYMEVTYADGKKRTFTENIAEELRNLVAVPEKFDSLPIYHINILIKGGDDLSTILKKKAGIEEMTQTSASDDLWKDYVSSMPKSRIAENIVVYLPLPKEYEGWRIVDTPGVGAIGGIQDVTKKLLVSKENDSAYAVDALILLHKCKENIEDESANSFAEDIRKSMGNLADGRLFFVLTYASDPDFIQYKDSTLDKAEKLFGSKLSIPRTRINYVDSLIHRFIISAKKSKKDFSNPTALQKPLDGWNEDDWGILKKLLSPIYMNFSMNSGRECTNSALFAELESISHFESLRTMLYEFLNDEKEKSFSALLSTIQSDLKSYEKSLKKDILSVSDGKDAINKQIAEVEKEKIKLDIALGKVRDIATRGVIDEKFSFVDTELQQLSQLKSISEVRTAYLGIIEKGIATEKKFFSKLISKFSSFLGDYRNTSLTFDSLDFAQIEREAESKSKSYVTDYSRPSTQTEPGGFSEDDKVITTYPFKKEQIDFDIKRREFTALVIKKGRQQCADFKNGLNEKIYMFFLIASSNINEKTDAAIKRLEEYKCRLADKDSVLLGLNSKLSDVEDVLSQLKKYEK